MALSSTTVTWQGEEHGSAHWGDVFGIARRYRDKRGGGLILTQNFAIGWDGYRHKHNTSVLVVGGSGAGKTRGYCVPNILGAAGRSENAPACSIVCTDPKAEVLRKTAALLIARRYKVRVLDLTDPAALFCYTPVFAADDPLAIVNNLSDFIFSLIRAVGIILLGWDVVQVGLSFQSHDPSQRSQGFLTLADGLVITFARESLALIGVA